MRDRQGFGPEPSRRALRATKAAFMAAMLAATSGAATAQTVYRCPGPGGVPVFQQAPCGGTEGQRVEVRPTNVVGSQPVAVDLARDVVVRRAIARGEIVTGMTVGEVHQVLGLPRAVNSSAGSYGTRDQLVYRYPDGSARYVYLRDGLVDSVSTHSGSGRQPAREPCYSAQDIRNARVGAESNTLPIEERQRRLRQAERMERCRR